jgi:hypothetical protein
MPSFMDWECIITAAPYPAFDVYPPSRRGDDPASEADHRDGPRHPAEAATPHDGSDYVSAKIKRITS